MPSQPGTALHRKLSTMGIAPMEGCSCQTHVNEMDQKGLEWCELHVEEILDWMSKEAKTRRVIFFRFGARMIVKRVFKFCRIEEER